MGAWARCAGGDEASPWGNGDEVSPGSPESKEWLLLGPGGCGLYEKPESLWNPPKILPESDPDAKLVEGGGCSEEQLVGEMRSAKLNAVSSGCEGRGKKSLNWQSMSRLSKLNSTMFDMSKASSLEEEREDVEEELEEWE